MKGNARVVLKYAAYAAGTLLLTLYFMFLTFPFSRLQDRLLPGIEAALPVQLAVGQVRASPLLWLRWTDVQAFPRAGERKRLLEVSELRLRPVLFDLLIGRISVRLRADLMDGTVKGKVASRRGNLDLAFSWKGVRPGLHPMLAAQGAPRVEGGLSGALRFSMEGTNWITGEGNLSAEITQGAVQGLQVYGFTLPDIHGLRAATSLSLGKRKALIETLALSSDELTASLDGSIDLSPRFPSSRLNLAGKVKLAGPLETQVGPMLSGFLRARDGDGFHTFSLRGTLGTPRFSG